MPVSLGLNIGESFADFVAESTVKNIPPQRLYLARKSLGDGLKGYLGEQLELGGQILISTSLSQFAVQKRLGSQPTFLITAGFENWLKLSQPLADERPQMFPTREPLPVSDDHVFGIAERMRADGTVETALSEEDLQFLASKLELLKTRTVAVGLLHSTKNPAHELRIREILEPKGFRVFCSHEFAHDAHSETERWVKVLKAASVWTAVSEQKLVIETALGDHKEKWKIKFIAHPRYENVLFDSPGLETELGVASSLLAKYPNKTILHLDLEQFLWLQDGRIRQLRVQPTTPLQKSSWPFAVYSDNQVGYEPGPMAFGKSLQPTIFDILYLRERLETIEAVTPLLNEKSRPRILEALFTMSKEIPSKTKIDANTVAADMETALLDRINEELLLTGKKPTEILLTGAFARSLHPRLEIRRPDVRFVLAPDAEFAGANANLSAKLSAKVANA
jgi:N-methylhydantoinase A